MFVLCELQNAKTWVSISLCLLIWMSSSEIHESLLVECLPHIGICMYIKNCYGDTDISSPYILWYNYSIPVTVTPDIAHDLHFEISEVSNNHKQSINDALTLSSVQSLLTGFIRMPSVFHFCMLCFWPWWLNVDKTKQRYIIFFKQQ